MMENMETPTAMTPPRPKITHPKAKLFHVRMNDAEMALLNEAATALGSPTSTWARVTLLAEARKVLRRAREQ